MEGNDIETVLVEIFRKAGPHLEIYYMYMEKWLDGRLHLIKSIKEIADTIDEYTYNSNITKTKGAGLSAVGVGLTLGGFVFPSLAIVGMSVGLAGGVTSAGASVAQGSFENVQRGEVEMLIDEDQRLYRKIKEAVDAIDEVATEAHDALQNAVPEVTKDQITGAMLLGVISTGFETVDFIKHIYHVAISHSMSAAATGSVSAALAAGHTLAAIGRFASKGLLVSIPLTIIDLTSNIRDLVDKSATTQDLRAMTERMEKEYLEIKDRYVSLKQMAKETDKANMTALSFTGVRNKDEATGWCFVD